MVPPDGVNLYALLTRFRSTRFRRFLSNSTQGCAVSQASADIMAELVTGESVEEAKRLTDLFFRMIQGEELSDDEQDDLDEAYELASISRMPARVKCAELGWRTLDSILGA